MKLQVAVRTSGGVEIRDSYVERRVSSLRHSTNSKQYTDNAHLKTTTTSSKDPWSNARDYSACNNDTTTEPEITINSSWASLPRQSTLPPIVMQAVIGVNFIADHLKQQDEFNKV